MIDARYYPLPQNYDMEFKETSFSNPILEDYGSQRFTDETSTLTNNAGFSRINDPYKDQPGNPSMGIPSRSGISSKDKTGNPSMGIPPRGVAYDFPGKGEQVGEPTSIDNPPITGFTNVTKEEINNALDNTRLGSKWFNNTRRNK